ncbi:MAG: hypothetical protein P4L35_11445 [Ignavibacteriaceae bacterium]|nr:hypothetical protein [Ignavibacteriaceae bacterium]
MKRFLTALIFVLSTSILTFSQDFAKKGTWELGGSVGFTSSTVVTKGTSDPNGATTSFSFSPEAGYLLTDNFEVSLLPLSFTSSSYNGSTFSQFNFLVAPAWNFELQSNIYPYVEALLGYGSISSGGPSYSGLDYGAQAGVKLEVAKSSLVNLGLSYLMTTRKPSGITDRYGSNVLQIVAGFSVFLR